MKELVPYVGLLTQFAFYVWGVATLWNRVKVVAEVLTTLTKEIKDMDQRLSRRIDEQAQRITDIQIRMAVLEAIYRTEMGGRDDD